MFDRRKKIRCTLACCALGVSALWAGCEENQYAKAFKIEHMAQTIGGLAAMARPGDLMLENDRIRAVIHGRHNMRSTSPVNNGSLIDLDIQRPPVGYRVGQGRDLFYELGPMVNLKINASTTMEYGTCEEVQKKMGSSECPMAGCGRVSAEGIGDNIMGLLGLLDLAIKRPYDGRNLKMITDYDLCPGESFVRVTTTARFEDTRGKQIPMEELIQSTGLLDMLLGEFDKTISCEKDSDCPSGNYKCEDLLLPILPMKRCRGPNHKLGGVFSGDMTFFSGKVNVFVPDGGFNHDGFIRNVFDTGGDTFSNPLAKDFVAGVGKDVSYAYFNQTGKALIPVFTEAFTVALTNQFACPRSNPGCLKGKEVQFKRYVSVGQGDVASAVEPMYELRNIPFGDLDGHIISQRTRKPISGQNVYLFMEPLAWRTLDNAAFSARLAQTSLFQLMTTLRQEVRAGAAAPSNEVGIISHFKSDVGLDQVADGSISGPLPIHKDWCDVKRCRYILASAGNGHPPSLLTPVLARAGETSRATVIAGDPGTLEFQIKDPSGQHLPSKLTFGHCFEECAVDQDCPPSRPVCDRTSTLVQDKRGLCIPQNGYTGPKDCRPDQQWFGTTRTCKCMENGVLPVSMGGSRMADGTVHVLQSTTGHGKIHMEPGVYQVVVSRGFEYSTSRQFLTIKPGLATRITATLSREVDTKGWISADFHVHGPNSPDASATYEKRVASFVAEGVELLSATDHDQLTDYEPTIYKMGLRPWLKSQISLETSPVDYGHFIGFPLRFDENAELNGAFHWKVQSSTPGTFGEDWENMPPEKIFEKLRELGSLGKDKTVTFVAHFYDHFTYYSINPWTLEQSGSMVSTLINPINPVLTQFSGDFDALEAFNGKNFDILRRPTYAEVKDYNVKLAKFLVESKDWSYERRQRAWGNLSADSQREFMRRTPAEQKPAIGYTNKYFECRCTRDAECGSGSICDEDVGACGKGCTSDNQCDAKLVAAKPKRESCKAKWSHKTSKKCVRLDQTCTQDADCTYVWGQDNSKKDITEKCVARDSGAPSAKTCELSCLKDTDCSLKDPLRPICDTTKSICIAKTTATSLDPCLTLRGTIDDWFQMLNRGIRRPILGNSDTHDTYGTEAGIPRNYVKSSSDLPRGISEAEVAGNVMAMQTLPTYGPFVDISLNGQGMGSVVKMTKGQTATIKLKIQSARWFDVDRIEVYSNGELIKIISGDPQCAKDSNTCIRSPNEDVLNFDGTITDTPDKDAWYVVIVMGLDGKSLAPVYSSSPVARLGLYEVIQRLTPLLPPLSAFGTPLAPSMARVRPYAVTNPIWVDIGGDGLKPVSSLPSWATDDDKAGAGLSTTSITQGLGRSAHDHSKGLGRLRDASRGYVPITPEAITPEVMKYVLDSLRFISLTP